MPSPSHSDRAHAKHFSPSKSDSWVDCMAQPVLLDRLGLKDRRTAAADEGTGAHELFELSLTKGKHPKHWLGKTMKNGTIVTEEMVYYIHLCWAWTNGKVVDGYTLKAERKLLIKVTGDTGTTDITLWNPTTKHLIVGDLKYGKGYAVDPTKNRQMRLYACGTCDADGLWETVEHLTLVILQPRIDEAPSEWEDSPTGLRHFRDVVSERVATITAGIKLAKKRNLSASSSIADYEATGVCFKPSEKSCKWCPGRHGGCKAYATEAARQAGLDFANIVSEQPTPPADAAVMTTDELVRVWQNAGMFSDWLKTVGETLFNMLVSGTPVNGLKLVEGKSTRRWLSEGDTMESLHRLGYKADEFAPRSLAGLGVIERLFSDKKRREQFMRQHTRKPKGKASMAVADDPRPTYVHDEFANVEPDL